MAMVEFFNRVALLAATEILSQDTPSGRARAISKVIQVWRPIHRRYFSVIFPYTTLLKLQGRHRH